MKSKQTARGHGPENSEYELRKAYNCVIEAGVTHFWDRRASQGVNPEEVNQLYRRAFNAHRDGNRLSAERWARTAKHLARAFWHEAKIAYLEPRIAALPFLEGIQNEFNLSESRETTADLLDSVTGHPPAGMTEFPEDLARYLARAREHLNRLDSKSYRHELLRAERIKAAHEYGRVLECAALGYEAESKHSGRAVA